MLKRIFFDLDVSVENVNIGNIKEDNYNTIQLVMNIVNDGKPFDFANVVYAQMSFKLPNGDISNSLAVVDGQKVLYLMEPNTLNQLGFHEAELQLYGTESQLLISTTFYYNVVDALYDDSDLTEQEKYPILLDLISRVEAMLAILEEYFNKKFLAISQLDFYNNGYVAKYVDGSTKNWTYSVDDIGEIKQLVNETDNKIVTINWHNTER